MTALALSGIFRDHQYYALTLPLKKSQGSINGMISTLHHQEYAKLFMIILNRMGIGFDTTYHLGQNGV